MIAGRRNDAPAEDDRVSERVELSDSAGSEPLRKWRSIGTDERERLLPFAWEDQFAVGDVITVDGYTGTVVGLGLRTTKYGTLTATG